MVVDEDVAADMGVVATGISTTAVTKDIITAEVAVEAADSTITGAELDMTLVHMVGRTSHTIRLPQLPLVPNLNPLATMTTVSLLINVK